MNVSPPGARAKASSSAPCVTSAVEQHVARQPLDDGVDTLAGAAIGQQDWPAVADRARLVDQAVQIDPHMGCEIDLVDDQEVAEQHPRPALARDVVAARD